MISVLPIMPVGCRNDMEPADEFSGTQKAIVLFEGDPSVDGCGWLLSVNNKLYYPVNLQAAYHVDSLRVSVKYEVKTGTWTCGWRTPGYEKIEITQIHALKE
jgi:hypothetical protein